MSSGLVRRIIVAMDTHFSNAAVQHAGLLALWNVTEDPAVARTVLDAGPLSRVFQVGIMRLVSCELVRMAEVGVEDRCGGCTCCLCVWR